MMMKLKWISRLPDWRTDN